MRPVFKQSLIVIFVMAASLAGCLGGGRIQTASIRSGKLEVLPLEVGSYYFWPNEIRVDKPGPLTIAVKNVSGSPQNFTLKDPLWNTLENVDIPAGRTTRIKLKFSTPGIYQFYCNKSLGSLLGMNGQIYVGK